MRFTLDGQSRVWAETGSPNGHKILADGSHLVCDASRHAVLHLDSSSSRPPSPTSCDGTDLRGPNDLTLDTPHGGFYFELSRRLGRQTADRHRALCRRARHDEPG